MIRPILRSFVYTGAALWIITQLSGGGIKYALGFETFLLAALAISIGNHFIRPILNILLLPINLITLGLFRWVTNVLMLYAVTVIIKGFSIVYFQSSQVVFQGISIPAINIAGIPALLLISFLLSLITSLLYWLSR